MKGGTACRCFIFFFFPDILYRNRKPEKPYSKTKNKWNNNDTTGRNLKFSTTDCELQQF